MTTAVSEAPSRRGHDPRLDPCLCQLLQHDSTLLSHAPRVIPFKEISSTGPWRKLPYLGSCEGKEQICWLAVLLPCDCAVSRGALATSVFLSFMLLNAAPFNQSWSRLVAGMPEAMKIKGRLEHRGINITHSCLSFWFEFSSQRPLRTASSKLYVYCYALSQGPSVRSDKSRDCVSVDT